jgi:hypothetical protein
MAWTFSLPECGFQTCHHEQTPAAEKSNTKNDKHVTLFQNQMRDRGVGAVPINTN